MRTNNMNINAKDKPFPQYSSVNEAYEHFRLIRILFKYDGVPQDYLEHMATQVKKFKKKIDKVSVKKVNEMKNLLSGFEKTFDKSFKKIVENSSGNEGFSLALQTKKKNDGVVIGEYFIRIRDNKDINKKLYTIFGPHREEIIRDLHLYEIAYMLVYYLYSGLDFESEEVDTLLNLHGEYKKIANNYNHQKAKLSTVDVDDPNLNYHKKMVSGLKNSLNQVYSQVNSKYSRLINQEKTK